MTRLEGHNDNINERAEERRRLRQNVIAAAWIAILLAGGYWLVTAIIESNRMQECLARQHRSCAPLIVPARK